MNLIVANGQALLASIASAITSKQKFLLVAQPNVEIFRAPGNQA